MRGTRRSISLNSLACREVWEDQLCYTIVFVILGLEHDILTLGWRYRKHQVSSSYECVCMKTAYVCDSTLLFVRIKGGIKATSRNIVLLPFAVTCVQSPSLMSRRIRKAMLQVTAQICSVLSGSPSSLSCLAQIVFLPAIKVLDKPAIYEKCMGCQVMYQTFRMHSCTHGGPSLSWISCVTSLLSLLRVYG